MATNTRKLGATWPGASTAVTMPSSDEASLFANASLRNWYCASDGYLEGEWRCRKTGIGLIPAAQGFPVRSTLAAYNNDKAAVFSSVFSSLFDGSANILPVGVDFSIVLVGRHGPGDNAFLCGSGEGNLGLNTVGTLIQMVSTGALNAQVGGVSMSVPPTYTKPYASGPSLIILSWEHSIHRARLRVNGTLLAEKSTGMPVAGNTSARFYLGAAGSNLQGGVDGGDFAQAMIWSIPLAAPGNETVLGQVETHLMSRYAITS